MDKMEQQDHKVLPVQLVLTVKMGLQDHKVQRAKQLMLNSPIKTEVILISYYKLSAKTWFSFRR